MFFETQLSPRSFHWKYQPYESEPMKWNVGKIASKRAALTPEKIAIFFEDTPITYRELNQQINRVAHYFIEKGLIKGDRIAVDLLNCPEFLACYLAAAKLGLIFVPLNFRMVAREIAYQLNQCQCRLLIFHDLFIPFIEPIRHSIPVEKDKYICLSTPSSKCPPYPPWAMAYDEALSGMSTAEPEIPDPIDMDDPLIILYTSGVTGNPKGAVITHAQTYFKCFQIITYTDMRQDDIFQSQAPLCHSAGLCAVATPSLCRGATLLMRYHFDAAEFAHDIERYRATVVFGLTTMFRFILETGILDTLDICSVRLFFGGGERTPQSLLDALSDKGVKLLIGFGQTENSAMVLMPEDAADKKPGSVGKPNFFTELWIENTKGEKLPPGEIGEIVAVGPNVMKEYWGMPAETEQTIVNGVLHTGDLGYLDEDGFVYMVDRAKDMYRSGAENVFPAEVERVLADHPDIEAVAIIGVSDERWGETGKAYIVCKPGESLTLLDVHQFLQGKVARYKFPTLIEIVDSLPTTVWGKIKKGELKERHRELSAEPLP
jgi:fatty-acyl-CoA synthase